MTNQEAFDKMMAHLRSLKERSMDENGLSCVYNGSKCAVGALMTDEEQDKFGNYDGGAYELLDAMVRKGHTSPLHSLDLDLLIEMQDLHDMFYNWGDEGFISEERAEYIANEYKLTYTKP